MFKHDITKGNIKKVFNNPFQAFDETILQHFYRVPSTIINNHVGIGDNVFDREWDVLILLDCCRVDALRSVSDEYDFLQTVDSIRSVGGATPEWIAKTFTSSYREEIGKTAYLSGTAQLQGILKEQLPTTRSFAESHIAFKLLSQFDSVSIDDLMHVEHLFKCEPKGVEGPFGHPEGLTPPRYLTDRGIAVSQNHDFERLIIHYIQPHSPYTANAIRKDRELRDYERRPLRHLRQTGDLDLVWNLYLDELRWVLDEVELLIENIEADRIAISADHGEGFGEYGIYGHQIGSLHPKVRTVPWVVTSGKGTRSYTPEFEPPDHTGETAKSTEEMLQALGYKL